jgi:aspartyl-tRNA(Asn)/glutamyl-tRNA(Gln) amidotransferase subunit B
MNFDTVIGLEIHCELKTKTKIFCSCRNKFGGAPNTNCCPACSGHPGTLPVLNKQAVEYAVMAGIALNCKINKFSKFDRKNYFYPDLPKAYQVSQFDFPICTNGSLTIDVDGQNKQIRINRIHLEEDAGKLIHSEWGSGTLVDYNRGGVPLIEIVTEPDMSSPEEAIAFLENIINVLKYSGVSDCKMEEGSIRCDVNLSLKEAGSGKLGTRTEMKNLNSFKSAYKAMQYEIKRQTAILSGGGKVLQETRRWDDNSGKSYSMRSKEDAQDYRYFPDPDLVPLILDDEYINEIKSKLPELPAQKIERYTREYNLSAYDAQVLSADREVAEFFDQCCIGYDNKKALANWIMGDIMRKIKEKNQSSINIPVKPEDFIKLLNMYDDKTISQNAAREVLDKMWDGGGEPAQIVEKLGLKQISDTGELLNMVKEIIKNNPKPADDYRQGNKKALAFFVGQIMKATKGKANPQTLNELLIKELE